MRGVVDNNIWVSAILTRRGNPGRILDAFVAGQFTLVTSEPLLAELAQVLERPRIAQRSQLTRAEVEELIDSMRITGELVPVMGAVTMCRDPKDNALIETAVAGHAAVLVSGDRDLTDDANIVQILDDLGVRVLSAAQFERELHDLTS